MTAIMHDILTELETITENIIESELPIILEDTIQLI